MYSVAHVWSVYGVALAAISVAIAPVVVRQLLYHFDDLDAAVKRVCLARHIEVYRLARYVPRVLRGSGQSGVKGSAPESAGDLHRRFVQISDSLDVLALFSFQIGRIAGAVSPAAPAAELFRFEIFAVFMNVPKVSQEDV